MNIFLVLGGISAFVSIFAYFAMLFAGNNAKSRGERDLKTKRFM